MAGMGGQKTSLLSKQKRDLALEKINDYVGHCDYLVRRRIIERLAREILDDVQVLHLVELIEEITREQR